MRFWKICRRRYLAAALRGEGAALFPGRWNSRGTRLVYTSTSLALAAVESFVNLEPKLQPDDLVAIAGEVPSALEVERIGTASLPAGWERHRPESLQRMGDDWARAGRTVALLVPSAPVRGEWNLLLNPAHAEFARVTFEPPERFAFDLRMFR